MSVAISALVFVILIFSMTITLFDINKNMQLRQIIHENTRAATHNSLLELSNQYQDNKPISTMAMLEAWLVNFVDDNVVDISELVIEFIKINEDPPLFLVNVKGKSSASAFLTAELYSKIISGTMIIADD
ncbi:MAG: hypothetical protein VB009_03840 [Erysipelotrichaceae bacterium]|nr:hypothetical protein [Erysipelotrichaceae bacterium]